MASKIGGGGSEDEAAERKVEAYFDKALKKGLVPEISELRSFARSVGWKKSIRKLDVYKRNYKQLALFVEPRQPRHRAYQTVPLRRAKKRDGEKIETT